MQCYPIQASGFKMNQNIHLRFDKVKLLGNGLFDS